MTADAEVIRELLRARHAPPDWNFATEVRVEDLAGRTRFMDAVAARVTPNRFELHGFEVKTSRADWLNEVNDPGKSDGRLLLDAWWVVEGEAGLVLPEELPFGAGLISVGKTGLLDRVIALPRKRGHAGVDRELIAAFLRRLDPLEPRVYWNAQVRLAEQRGESKGRNASGRVMRKKARESSRDDGEPLNLP